MILNTHFSQKVYSDVKTTNPQAQPRPWPPLARCVPYSLANTFGLHGADAVKRKDATTEQVNGLTNHDRVPKNLMEAVCGVSKPPHTAIPRNGILGNGVTRENTARGSILQKLS